MGRLGIDEVVPGQTAARPVINTNGMVLVQAGTVLTEVLIGRLKGLGVSTIVVAGVSTSEQAKPVEEQLAEIEARFAGHEHDEVMMGIKRIVVEQVQGGR